MFRVKICGITSVADAVSAATAGADAVGLNFYPSSPRYRTVEQAREIAAALPSHVCKVGVFVGASLDDVHRAAREVPLDAVQLHGDEPPEFLSELGPLAIVRAMRVSGDMSAAARYLATCHRLRAMPRMVLVDAVQGERFGGTGSVVDWDAVVRHRQQLAGVPLVLAGGLNPLNVAEAIRTVRPWAVDVASGVEAEPGQKSPELVRQFVEAAKTAFHEIYRRA